MAKKKWTYSATRAGYVKLWNSVAIKGGADAAGADRFARLIIAGEHQYRAAGAALGVPWYFIGALHMRESGCDFRGVLHNGQKIIGKDKKTTLEPKGRGPFASWAEAAHDAMTLKGFERYRGQWRPSLMGYVSELYNGLGYAGKGINSAYLWAGSNHEQLGKYVADHVWDATHDDTQIGTMTVLKRLCELRPDIAKEMQETPMSMAEKAVVAGGVVTTGAGGTVAANDPTATAEVATDVATSSIDMLTSLLPIITSWGGQFALAFGAALIVGVVGWKFYQRRLD
jgi:lysozyme family protein